MNQFVWLVNFLETIYNLHENFGKRLQVQTVSISYLRCLIEHVRCYILDRDIELIYYTIRKSSDVLTRDPMQLGAQVRECVVFILFHSKHNIVLKKYLIINFYSHKLIIKNTIKHHRYTINTVYINIDEAFSCLLCKLTEKCFAL